MKAQVTLTPPESKRLIAKAVSQMAIVQDALKKGKILIAFSSTNSYILEELSGGKIDKTTYCSGIITKKGTYATLPSAMSKEALIVDGKVTRIDNSRKIIKKMNKEDIFIKSANAIDVEGNTGVFVSDSSSGELGHVIGHIYARKINLLIPTGLEKLIYNLRGAFKVAGQHEYVCSLGLPVSVFPLHGEVITEIDALKILFDVKATLIGAGGISGAEGSVTLVLEGNNVKEAFNYIGSIKGEEKIFPQPIEIRKEDCSDF